MRLAAISAATMALVLAGSAAVSAHPNDREDAMGNGLGLGRMGGLGWDDMGGFGEQGGRRGPLGGMFDEATDSFIRHETVYQTEDGTVTRRTDQGVVAGTADASLEYTLVTGASVAVTTDDATEIVSLGSETVELGRSGRMRERLVPESITLADLTAGSQVVVWAESQADGTFLAERIVLRPADEADDALGTDESAVAGDGSEAESEAPASPAATDA
jgi:hypothetical protein